MRLRAHWVLAAVVFLCGVAAASALSAGSRFAGQTVTVIASDPSAVTLVVPSSARVAAIQAARDDPSKVSQVPDAQVRQALQHELQSLDAFLATRPKLKPYRAHLWYVAHHSHARVSPQTLAALLWCTVWFPHDCG
jgi:hypothetical protein